MQRSKSFALLVVLATFVAGIALGFTGDRLLDRDKHGRRDRPSRDRIAKELNLTATQRAQFDSITTSRRTQMRELFKAIRPQMDSLQAIAKVIGDSTHEQLKRVLNSDQAKKFDEMRERGRKHASQSREKRDSGKGQPPPTP